MATWPAKTNYATGDVLTAAQMNDIGGELNDVYNTSGAAAGKNKLINGGFDIWQRSTSSASSPGYYSADRWAQFNSAGSGTFARTTSNIATGQVYGLSWTSSGAASQGNIYQAIETLNAVSCAGQTITISGYLYGTVGKQVKIELGTSTTDNLAWNGGYSFTSLSTITLTATVTRYTATVTVASNVRSLCVAFSSVSTFNSTEGWTVSAAQLEIGSTASPFSRAGGDIQGELAACQRYYWINSSDSVALYKRFATGVVATTTNMQWVMNYPVPMRVAPSMTTSGSFTNRQGDTSLSTNAPTLQGDGTNTISAGLSSVVTAGVAGSACYLRAENSSSTYIAFSAEL